ncbi:hypothetical protein CFC21_077770 [Triticum aestivum]|uniref:F-box domain-containing protein n=3 Tax=Triticum aestivum TaxID=4565 RepID=A0A9R1L049_WHEAT|nr:hypothetical protein CFC21_077770 [Triticum aestivum]
MARKDLLRRRRACDNDRLSALPDDLLLLILRRLDSRTAHGAAVLSKRWAHLPRELTALDLKATDTLPQRYRRCLLRRREATRSLPLAQNARKLEDIAGRYQRRAMRSMVASVRSLLASGLHRRVNRLSLEIFEDNTLACINSLIVDAVDSWGVQDLVVVATPTERTVNTPPAYDFPHGRTSRKPGESRLQSLKLAKCLPPPLEGFTALTTLVVQDLPRSTPAAVYRRAIAACPQLQILHLIRCGYKSKAFALILNAPMSGIRELLVDGPLMLVEIRSLPKLQSLTVLHATLLLSSAASPCIEHASFVFSVDQREGSSFRYNTELETNSAILMRFFQAAVGTTDLALRIAGPGMWIALKNPVCQMANVRRLLIADVPSSWDVSGSGPHLLIDAAPFLESIHVHVPKPEEEPCRKPPRPPSTARRHRHLKELVVIGFQGTERHLHLVRYAVEASTALSRVALFKHGHVKEKGPCGWEMVTLRSKWSDEEKRAVLDRVCCPTAQIEVVLG